MAYAYWEDPSFNALARQEFEKHLAKEPYKPFDTVRAVMLAIAEQPHQRFMGLPVIVTKEEHKNGFAVISGPDRISGMCTAICWCPEYGVTQHRVHISQLREKPEGEVRSGKQ